MVTKAIIESVESQYLVKVRIPILDSSPEFVDATNYDSLSDATICTLPRTSYVPEIGDIVFVAFEDNDKGRPIIIGCLFKESGNDSQVNIEANNLIVNSKTQLSSSTSIGNISYDELKYLEGLKQNIQATFQNIEDRLKELEGNT